MAKDTEKPRYTHRQNEWERVTGGKKTASVRVVNECVGLVDGFRSYVVSVVVAFFFCTSIFRLCFVCG